MAKHTGAPAESFWEDGIDDEAECERFLQHQKARTGPEDDEASVETMTEAEETEEEEDAEREEVVAEDDSDIGDDSDDSDEESDEEDSESEDIVSEEESDPAAEDETPEAAQLEDRKMAKTKVKAGGKTKAEAIREVIEKRKKAGTSLRPRDIIEELANNGFEVNASQVSVTLRNMGVPAAPRGRAKGSKMKSAEAPAEAKSRVALKRGVEAKLKAAPAANGQLEETEHLLDAAGEFIGAAGGYEKAVSLLGMYNRLLSRG